MEKLDMGVQAGDSSSGDGDRRTSVLTDQLSPRGEFQANEKTAFKQNGKHQGGRFEP